MNLGHEKNSGIKEKYLHSTGIGDFLFKEDENLLVFRDEQEKEHSLEKVLLLSEEYDIQFSSKNIPTPTVKAGEEIRQFGAKLLYSHVGNTNNNIIVLGPVRDFIFNDPLVDLDTTSLDSILEKVRTRNNDKRAYKIKDNGKGNIFIFLLGKPESDSGNLSVKIIGDNNQKNGNVKLQFNGKLSLDQISDNGEINSQLFFDNTEGDEKISLVDKHKNKLILNKKGSILETKSIRIGKEETIAKILKDFLEAIKDMQLNTNQGPTIKIPINWADFESILGRIDEFMNVQ